MRKKVISKKQGTSLKNIPNLKLKKNVLIHLTKFNGRIEDKEFIFRALWQCLIDQDIESFKEILRTHLEAINKQNLSKKSQVSARTIYRILSPQGNPTIKSISKVIHALYHQ